MPYLREGTCNQCGQCCGAVTAPNPASPFPVNWWQALRKWSLDDVNANYPHLSLMGFGQVGQDTLGVTTPVNQAGKKAGRVRAGNTWFYFVWDTTRTGGEIPFKDTSLGKDGTSHNQECPFLKADPGNGSRPCGLVGTNDEGARQKWCRPETHPTDYVPANDIWQDFAVAQWQTDHPSCSYVFVEVPA